MARTQTPVYITANGETLTATLVSNASTQELQKMLPLTIRMSDYGGWEKVGELPRQIARDDRQLTARAGDIMLYQGRSIVIFYGDNTWAYTPLGRIDNASAAAIEEFLNGDEVKVTFSLSPVTGIETVIADRERTDEAYDLCGRKVRSGSGLKEGFYIVNGKKTLITKD